jgi:predicted metal-dependent hydrolase
LATPEALIHHSRPMTLFPLNFGFLTRPVNKPLPAGQLEIDGRTVPILYHRSDRAKRYLLRVDREGTVRVTIPRRGSQREAEHFVQRRNRWLAKHLQRVAALPKRHAVWLPGHAIFLRGSLVPLRVEIEAGGPVVKIGEEIKAILPPGWIETADLRPWVERHLRSLATADLRARTAEMAALHGLTVEMVQVRSQISRWGSCSSTGALSLNWKLIQTPIEVRDYVIVHELMHRRELNHSARFWAWVETACPNYRACEQWLNEHGRAIL